MAEFQPPVREDLRGLAPYGAPQLDVDVRLNVNENPFAPSPELARALGASVTEAAQTLNRYPDRECVELRQALADYLSQESNAECAVESIWVANGSNEVMSHIMAAFGGPGRVALTFPPTYSMYPEYARESFTTLVSVLRTTDFQIDMAASTAAIEDQRPDPKRAATLLEEADALAAEGRFAEAVHLLLFRSIEDLRERRSGGVPQSLTAREISSLSDLTQRTREALSPIIRIVENSFFGGRPVDQTGWQSARSSYESFAFGGAAA